MMASSQPVSRYADVPERQGNAVHQPLRCVNGCPRRPKPCKLNGFAPVAQVDRAAVS